MAKNQTIILFLTNGLTALSFAVVTPIMSLFIVDELHAEPALIGIYASATAFISMIVRQKLTGLIDKGVSGKFLLITTLCGIALATSAFSIATEFWHVLLIGCLLMPIASSSIPVLLSIIRKYADATGKNSAKLNSQMRSSVSLLWIVGPPLAFLSVDKLGFDSNFHLSAAIACIVIILVALCLHSPVSNSAKKQTENTNKLPAIAWGLGAVIFLANLANSAYINAMPIYLTSELGLASSYSGILFGFTAAVEIPVMLLAVGWSQRLGKTKTLKLGFVAASLFYTGMYFASSFPVFVVLQLLNGLFFGIFVGLGITIMQDFAPQCVGKASAFYSNAMLVGTMAGTSLMGMVSQYFGFRAPLLLCLTSICLSFVALIFFEKSVSNQQESITALIKV